MMTDDRVGVEILHLFIQDLLGRDTTAARIFRAKTDEDYTTLPVVTMKKKLLAGVLLALLNLFFVYFSILRGHQKGIDWQRVFVIACVVQATVEIVFNETIECLYIHYLVPRMVSKQDLVRVREVLHSCIEKVVVCCCCCCCCCSGTAVVPTKHLLSHKEQEGDSDSDSDSGGSMHIMNTPHYLFVSTNVANSYPLLMESRMVLSYHTHLPIGVFSEKWTTKQTTTTPTTRDQERVRERERESGDASSSVYGRMRGMLQTMSMTCLVLGMHSIAYIPLSLQKMCVRVFEPVLVGGMLLLWLHVVMASGMMGVIVFVCMVTGIIAWLVYRYLIDHHHEGREREREKKQKQKQRRVNLTHHQSSSDHDSMSQYVVTRNPTLLDLELVLINEDMERAKDREREREREKERERASATTKSGKENDRSLYSVSSICSSEMRRLNQLKERGRERGGDEIDQCSLMDSSHHHSHSMRDSDSDSDSDSSYDRSNSSSSSEDDSSSEDAEDSCSSSSSSSSSDSA